jgi:hypothetical protein
MFGDKHAFGERANSDVAVGSDKEAAVNDRTTSRAHRQIASLFVAAKRLLRVKIHLVCGSNVKTG